MNQQNCSVGRRIYAEYLMIKDKSIYIKNIYYMLFYAFQILKQSNYDEVASEKFEKAQDLFAAILSKGIAQQLKQGLYREYVTKNETLTIMRGKLDMPNTIRNRCCPCIKTAKTPTSAATSSLPQ